MNLRKVLGLNIKQFRKTQGFSQEKIAELCNLSTNYISELELGKKFPSADAIVNIAENLKIRPFMLFVEEGYTVNSISKKEHLTMEEKDNLKKSIYKAIEKIINDY